MTHDDALSFGCCHSDLLQVSRPETPNLAPMCPPSRPKSEARRDTRDRCWNRGAIFDVSVSHTYMSECKIECTHARIWELLRQTRMWESKTIIFQPKSAQASRKKRASFRSKVDSQSLSPSQKHKHAHRYTMCK